MRPPDELMFFVFILHKYGEDVGNGVHVEITDAELEKFYANTWDRAILERFHDDILEITHFRIRQMTDEEFEIMARSQREVDKFQDRKKKGDDYLYSEN